MSHGGLAGLATMWVAMMGVMMLPAAAPMTYVFATAKAQRAGRAGAIVPVSLFLAGYLLVWSVFGIAAALLQMRLESAGFLGGGMALANPVAAGLVLVGAGLYQWLPPKRICLEKCRSPLSFILLYWKEGLAGALALGARHGAFCVGCCWALMLLLFAGGVMNVWLIAALVALVLMERLMPSGQAAARLGGAGLATAGLYFMAFM